MAKTLGCKLHLFHAYDIRAVHFGKMMEQDEIEDNIMEAREKIKKYVCDKDERISTIMKLKSGKEFPT